MAIKKIDEVYRVEYEDGTIEYHEKSVPAPVDDPGDKPDPDDPPGGGDDTVLWEWAVASKELVVREVPSFSGTKVYVAVKDSIFQVKPQTVDGDLWVWRETREGLWVQEYDLMKDERVLSIGLPSIPDDPPVDPPTEPADYGAYHIVNKAGMNVREAPSTTAKTVGNGLNYNEIITLDDAKDKIIDDGQYFWRLIVDATNKAFIGNWVAQFDYKNDVTFIEVWTSDFTIPPLADGGRRELVGNITVVDKGDRYGLKVVKGEPQVWDSWRKGIMNLRPLAFIFDLYAQNGVTQAIVDEELDHLNHAKPVPPEENHINMGGVRYWMAYRGLPVSSYLSRNRQALNWLRPRRMQGVININDSHFHSRQTWTGEDAWHTLGDEGHLNHKYWEDEVYKTTFVPQLEALVKDLMDTNGDDVLLMNLINEPRLNDKSLGQPIPVPLYSKFKSGIDYISEKVAKWTDYRIPIAVGLQHVGHIQPAGWSVEKTVRDFYGDLEWISVMTGHAYASETAERNEDLFDGEAILKLEAKIAAELGRVYGVLECMTRGDNKNIPYTVDQKGQLELFLKRMWDLISFYGIWGSHKVGIDMGYGDTVRGYDHIYNNAFGPIRKLLHQVNTQWVIE